MITNEETLYHLVQANDNESILVAHDLAIELNCGLLSIYNTPTIILSPASRTGKYNLSRNTKYLSRVGMRDVCCAKLQKLH